MPSCPQPGTLRARGLGERRELLLQVLRAFLGVRLLAVKALDGYSLAVARPAVHGAESAAADFAPGREQITVMVVDDEPDVLRLAARWLKRSGYNVIEAASGDEALTYIDERNGNIDVLFSDIVMPGQLNGWALAEAVSARYPKIGIQLATGYDQARRQESGRIAKSAFPVLFKPYNLTDLSNSMRRLMQGNSSRGQRGSTVATQHWPLALAASAGAREVRLIEEPMAAAIGIGIDVEEPMGNMIIDIGGGTSEIAVIALGGIVCGTSIRIAGDDFTSDIEEYMRRQHNILVGERTAEQIKIEVGAALPDLEAPPDDFAVRGRDLMTGIPKEIMVSYSEVAHALDKTISKIEEAILNGLQMTPPELSADIYKTGIYLAGGGPMLRGLDDRISANTKLPVHIAEDPLRAVARGTSIALKNIDKYQFLIKD